MGTVEPLRVQTLQMAHHTGEITLRSPKTNMVVVAHKTVSKDFNAPKLMGLGESPKKRFIVLFPQEGLLPGTPTVHDMIDSSWKLNPKWVRHQTRRQQNQEHLSTKDLTPFLPQVPLLMKGHTLSPFYSRS
jgi:hypothetical protein